MAFGYCNFFYCILRFFMVSEKKIIGLESNDRAIIKTHE